MCQAFPVVQGLTAGNGEEPSHLSGFTPERLQFWRAPRPSTVEETRVWIPAEERGSAPVEWEPGRSPAFSVISITSTGEMSATSPTHPQRSPFSCGHSCDLSFYPIYDSPSPG